MLADERARGARMVEVDVREQQVPDLLQLESARGKSGLECVDRRRGAAVEEPEPVVGLDDVDADDAVDAQVHEVDRLEGHEGCPSRAPLRSSRCRPCRSPAGRASRCRAPAARARAARRRGNRTTASPRARSGAGSGSARHAPAFGVAPLIRAVIAFLVCRVSLDVSHDPPAVGRERMQPPQHALRLRLAREQAEVVHEEDDRVERAQRVVEVFERQHLRFPHAAAAGDADASGETSIATTSRPRCCSSSATRPAPTPTSRTRPRT